MRLLHILRSRVRSVLHRNRCEDDLAEELQLHIERQAEEWIAEGADPVDARLRARRQFGNIESLKEESRQARGTAVWDSVVRDTRQAARRLVRDWRFSVPAVLLLALGIGATTATFSVVNATLFRPASFTESDRLVDLYQDTRDGAPGTNSYPAYLDMAAATHVFADVMAASIPMPVNYREGRGPVRRAIVEYTTPTYPAVLGLRLSLGRWFTTHEERPGAPVVAVLGHEAWTRRFGADRNVIGRTLYVQGMEATIIGVGPPGYRGMMNIGIVTDFWLPIGSALSPLVAVRRPIEAPFFVKARLRDGVTVAQAQAAMDALGKRLATEYPKEDPGQGISVFATSDVRVHPQMDRLLRGLASLLLAVVGLVLAIACSNLATLLLVRAMARAKEVSIRLAVGATRWLAVRHLLVESLLLSLVGGAIGATLAWWVMRSLRAVELPITVDFGVDARVLGFALALSVLTGVLFGVGPALKATRVDLLSVIREDGHTTSPGRRWFTLRNSLVVFQVTASVVMLTAAGAFLQLGGAAATQRIGFAVKGVAWIQTDARYSGYTPDRAAAMYDEVQRRTSALPGVQAVTVIQGEPMEAATLPIVVEGSTDGVVGAASMWAGPGFFEVMQIPILFGRGIDTSDRNGSPHVAVITESMARRYFGAINAVGRRFRVDQQAQWIEVIGVVGDTGTSDREGEITDPQREIFFHSIDQTDGPAILAGGRSIAARTSGDAAALVRELQRELLAFDPSLPILSAMTMERRIAESLARPRAVAGFVGAVGIVGLVLAGVGLYAVIAFAVSRRAREIGIRIALGAQSRDVVRDVARDVTAVLGTGAGVGLLSALLVIMAMRTFSSTSNGVVSIDLYRPHVDPWQLGTIVGFIVAVGLAAAFVPARRAARMNPLSALRQE